MESDDLISLTFKLLHYWPYVARKVVKFLSLVILENTEIKDDVRIVRIDNSMKNSNPLLHAREFEFLGYLKDQSVCPTCDIREYI